MSTLGIRSLKKCLIPGFRKNHYLRMLHWPLLKHSLLPYKWRLLLSVLSRVPAAARQHLVHQLLSYKNLANSDTVMQAAQPQHICQQKSCGNRYATSQVYPAGGQICRYYQKLSRTTVSLLNVNTYKCYFFQDGSCTLLSVTLCRYGNRKIHYSWCAASPCALYLYNLGLIPIPDLSYCFFMATILPRPV